MAEPDEEYDDEPRPLALVLAKVAAVVVGIGVLVAVGTIVMVKALGLNSAGSGGPVTSTPVAPVSPLPSSALPVPGSSSSSRPSSLPSPKVSKKLQLAADPVQARPMERVNLTGRYPGHDAVSLQVQRFENGQWTNFSGVTASVDLGTFQTFVMTGRTGDNKFRVFDPQSQVGSNPVTVTIG